MPASQEPATPALWEIAVSANEHDDDQPEWPKGAIAMTKNLDLLADEPLELAVALRKHAETQATRGDEMDPEWAKFAQSMSLLVGDLQALNEPGRASDAKSE